MRALTPPEVERVEEDAPSPRRTREKPPRENSGVVVAGVAVDVTRSVLKEHMGIDLNDQATKHLSRALELSFNNVLARIETLFEEQRGDQPKKSGKKQRPNLEPSRIPLGWIVLTVSVTMACVAACAIAFFSLWSRVDGIETAAVQDQARLQVVEQRTSEADEYSMIVANWLVRESDTNYQRALNSDRILRIIATKVDADVSEVAAPVKSEPPAVIQKKNRAYNFFFDPVPTK